MNWKNSYKKALTFSYDDGTEQDLRLLEIFNRYGLKCTFNLNTGLGPQGAWDYKGKMIQRLDLATQKDVYAGHEIAAHALTHPNLVELGAAEAAYEMEEDAKRIEELFGRKPAGMAYPYGLFDDAVVEMLKKQGFQYARTIMDSHNFEVQEDLLRFCPTCHHDDPKLFELAEEFLALKPDRPQIFYVWGHSFELEGNENWDRIEEFCRLVSGKDDIFYGTNEEVLLEM